MRSMCTVSAPESIVPFRPSTWMMNRADPAVPDPTADPSPESSTMVPLETANVVFPSMKWPDVIDSVTPSCRMPVTMTVSEPVAVPSTESFPETTK